MGFRTPLTAAEEVDTTLGGRQPGVKIYTRGGNPSSGVVEWSAGFSNVRGELTSSDTGSGGTVFSLGMVGLNLGLAEQELPAGGYEAVARLVADRAEVPLRMEPARLQLLDTTRWSVYDPGGGYLDPYAWQTVDGQVHIQGMVRANTAGAWPGGAEVARIPVGFPPPGIRGANIWIQLGFNNTWWRCDLTEDGRLLWGGGETGVAYAVGNYLTLNLSYLPWTY
jgi:hypothetical protein